VGTSSLLQSVCREIDDEPKEHNNYSSLHPTTEIEPPLADEVERLIVEPGQVAEGG